MPFWIFLSPKSRQKVRILDSKQNLNHPNLHDVIYEWFVRESLRPCQKKNIFYRFLVLMHKNSSPIFMLNRFSAFFQELKTLKIFGTFSLLLIYSCIEMNCCHCLETWLNRSCNFFAGIVREHVNRAAVRQLLLVEDVGSAHPQRWHWSPSVPRSGTLQKSALFKGKIHSVGLRWPSGLRRQFLDRGWGSGFESRRELI